MGLQTPLQSGLGCQLVRPAGGSLVAEAAHSAVGAPESKRRRRFVALSIAVSASLLMGVATPLVLAGVPAGADQVATLQQSAQYIAGEIQAAQVQLQILDESYLEAQGSVSLYAQAQSPAPPRRSDELKRPLTWTGRTCVRSPSTTYVTGGASQSLAVVFNGSEQTAGMQQAYMQAASGNLDETETTVLINQRALTLERATLNRTEQIAKANAAAIANDLTQEKAISAQLSE